MDSALLYIVMALGISTVLNLFLKRLGVSQIIGYILTGTILVYTFDLRHFNESNTLEHIGEFGIVFSPLHVSHSVIIYITVIL